MRTKADKLVGALNGAFGDLLAKHDNPLAQEMQLYFFGHNLETNPQAKTLFESTLENNPSKTVAIFVHGLGNTEHIWDFEAVPPTTNNLDNEQSSSFNDDNYGSRLMENFAITPLFLRYNTGLTLEDNGRQFNAILDKLFEAYASQIEQLILIGFSMGGLITRSAQAWAQQNQQNIWLDHLKHAIYIGTPHEGAPLEKFVNHASNLISLAPKAYLKIWSEQINLRSDGVKNLATKHSEYEKFEFTKSCEHYFIAGSIWRSEQKIANWMFGDSLVRKDSAHPKDRPLHSKIAYFEGIHHMRLAHSNSVWKQLRTWLADYYPEQGHPDASSLDYDQIESLHHLHQQQHLQGALHALSSASKHTINLSEAVHASIASEPFKVLNRIPLLKEFSQPIESSHNRTSSQAYSILRNASSALQNKTSSSGKSDSSEA